MTRCGAARLLRPTHQTPRPREHGQVMQAARIYPSPQQSHHIGNNNPRHCPTISIAYIVPCVMSMLAGPERAGDPRLHSCVRRGVAVSLRPRLIPRAPRQQTCDCVFVQFAPGPRFSRPASGATGALCGGWTAANRPARCWGPLSCATLATDRHQAASSGSWDEHGLPHFAAYPVRARRRTVTVT